MRALSMVGKNQLEMADIAVPTRPANWALVRVRASALGLFHQQMAAGMIDTGGLPRILGHEVVGEIVEADSPAAPLAGSLVVGDAVVGCGVCEWCVRGSESICPWMRHLGIDLDGGFADYAVVPESNLFALSPDTPLAAAVPLSSALPAAVRGGRRSGLAAGSRMVISGVGSIGFTVCQVARAMGATRIVAADVAPDHLAAVEPWVDATVDVSGMSPTESAEALREALGAPHGADLTFEASGHPSSVDTVLRAARPGGTVVLMGIVHGAATLHFDDFLFDCIKRELNIIATFGFTRADFLLGNALYESGALDLRPLIGPTVSLEGVPEALAAIAAAGTGGKRQVVDIAIG
ncbi:MAG: alcohol dehydrogenase catalytic domain-containing protein [bacterium]|nr:alcohol dehydrogenase catalytic domain-containing protein [bacterium]